MKNWQGWVAILLLLGVPAEVAAKPKLKFEEQIALFQADMGKNGSANPFLALEPSMIMGRLDQNSYLLVGLVYYGDRYYNRHTIEGIAGQSIIIELTSLEIEPALLLLDRAGNIIAEDEDLSDPENARIVITLEQTGLYDIIASTNNSGGWGNYSLTWREVSQNDIFLETDSSNSDNPFPLSRMWQQLDPTSETALEDMPSDSMDTAQTLEEIIELSKDPNFWGEFIETSLSDLATARASNDRVGEMSALGNLGSTYEYLQDYTQALEYYQQALSIAREVNDRSEEARFLSSVGLANPSEAPRSIWRRHKVARPRRYK